MAEVSMELVKALRDETGVSIMQCKKALEEMGGDIDKARIALEKRRAEVVAKKGDRTLGAGTVVSYIHGVGNVGAMVELSCETDFVARTEDFKKLAHEIAMHVAAMNPPYISEKDIDEKEKEKAMEIFKDEIKSLEGKPEEIKQKALQGKFDGYFKERMLMHQPFIKNPEMTVGDMISTAVQKFGERTEVTRIARFAVGQ